MIALNKKRTALVLVLMGAAMIIGLKYGCFIKNTFGVECPSCGISRAWFALLRGRVREAFEYHPMFWFPPLLLIYLCHDKQLVGKVFDIAVPAVLLAIYFAVYFIGITE